MLQVRLREGSDGGIALFLAWRKICEVGFTGLSTMENAIVLC